MTYTAIWIVAYLLNGTPVAFAALLPGDSCTAETARNVYDAFISDHGRNSFQVDTYEFWCDAVSDKTPKDGA
jgi:hypothetical protein